MHDVQPEPALPWAAGEGGTITLAKAMDASSQLAQGALIFELQENGVDVPVSRVRFRYAGNGMGHIQVDDQQVFSVNLYPSDTAVTTLALNIIPGQTAYSVKAVRLANIRYRVEIFKDQACTQKPQRGDVLQTVYVKFADDFDDTAQYNKYNAQNRWASFAFVPATEQADATINAYLGYTVDAVQEGDPVSGQVFEAIATDEHTIDQDITTGFNEIYEP